MYYSIFLNYVDIVPVGISEIDIINLRRNLLIDLLK